MAGRQTLTLPVSGIAVPAVPGPTGWCYQCDHTVDGLLFFLHTDNIYKQKVLRTVLRCNLTEEIASSDEGTISLGRKPLLGKPKWRSVCSFLVVYLIPKSLCLLSSCFCVCSFDFQSPGYCFLS